MFKYSVVECRGKFHPGQCVALVAHAQTADCLGCKLPLGWDFLLQSSHLLYTEDSDKGIGTGLAGPVLAGPLLKRNSILQKASNKQKHQSDSWVCQACYITVRQVEKPYQQVENYWPPTHAIYFYVHKIFCFAKVSNRQSAIVIFRFRRLTMTLYNRYKSFMSIVKYIDHPRI